MQIYVSKNGQNFGPYTSEQVQSFLQQGNFLPTDLVWYEGLGEWQPAGSVFPSQPQQPQQPKPPLSVPIPPARSSSTATRQIVTSPGSQYAQVPSRPASHRPVAKTQAPSRSPLVPIAIICVALVSLWLGTTLVVSLMTKSQFEKSMAANTVSSLVNYRMGLFSSVALTRLDWGEKTSEGENAVGIRHKIWHGPLAFPEGKPKLGIGYMRSTISPDKNKDEQFGASMFSELALNGETSNSINFDPVEVELEDGTKFVFNGGKMSLTANADQSKFSGSMDISAMEFTSSNGNARLDPIKGTIDFRQGSYLEIDAQLGGMKIELNGEEAKGVFHVEPPQLEAKYRVHSSDLPLYVGKTSLSFPLIKVEGMMNGAVQDIELSSRTLLDSKSKVNSSTKFEFDSLLLGEASSPLFKLDATSLEYGFSGIDGVLLAQLNDENQDIYIEQFKSGFNEDGGDLDDAERMEAVNRIVTLWLGLVQPGAEVFARLQLGGPESTVDIGAEFGGDKKLTETKTLRELITALKGDLKLRIGGDLMESPIVGMQVQGLAQGGLGTMDGNSFRLDGAIENGTVSLGGEATPILEMLGPTLDEPLDWDEILTALQSASSEPPSE